MKTLYKVFAAIVAASVLSAAAFAADPSGTWTFSGGFGRGGQGGGGGQAGPNQGAPGGGQGRGAMQQTLTLTYASGQLTGQLAGGRGEPVAIMAGSVKDDMVEFSVERTGRDGTKRVTKYAGKLAGDTITGTLEGPGRGGEVMKREWVATRAK